MIGGKSMSDLISRQEAIQALDNAAELWNIAEPYHEGIRAGYKNSARLIMSLPSAQPERKKGKWIGEPKDGIEAMFFKPKCSVCGFESAEVKNYCPMCGSFNGGAE